MWQWRRRLRLSALRLSHSLSMHRIDWFEPVRTPAGRGSSPSKNMVAIGQS